MGGYWYHEPGVAVKYTPVTSFIELSFFKELATRKLDDFKLNDASQPITGFSVRLKFLNKFHDTPVLNLDATAFEDRVPSTTNVTLRGTILNVNTIEEFKAIDKKQLLQRWGESLKSHLVSQKSPRHFDSFHIISFLDLKKFKFYYWVAHPSLHSLWIVTDHNDSITSEEIPLIQKVVDSDYEQCFFQLSDKPSTFVFVDGCTSRTRKPSSVLMNYLYGLALLGKDTVSMIIHRPNQSSFKLKLKLRAPPSNHDPPFVTGWERNDAGNLGPKLASLALLIDPATIADQAVDLNLKLMKWRIAPALDLNIIKNQRVLLLGAGTLGCYVGRALMAWGVRNITFADNGRVSHSNPVRQPLFAFDDCLADNGRGAFKAQCAATAMNKVFPGVTARGEILLVPMIGHLLMPETQANFDNLCSLIKSHDVVFLLLDLREARWLPTVISKSMGKLVINAALGYDSLMVMRHGSRNQDLPLGCYYCNDVYAPSDSLTDRTLDQMCTVTRPGGALMASALAVELMVSVLQHPMHQDAPHDGDSHFGSVPHQIRAYLSTFEQVRLSSTRYKNCAACSDVVLDRYLEEGWDFVSKCLESSAYLEKACGLLKVQQDAEVAAQLLLEGLEISDPRHDQESYKDSPTESDVENDRYLDEEWLR